MAALSIGQSAMSFMAQSDAVEEQNRVKRQNDLNARLAFEEKDRNLGTRQAQEQDAANAQKFDGALAGQKAQASSVVAAGEAGVSGLSVDSLLRDFSMEQARFNSRVDQNTEMTMSQLQQEKKAAGYQMVDRQNSMQFARKPSFAELGLKIAGAGINAAATSRSIENGSYSALQRFNR